jgi:branched-chain amino acid transport system permease protein
MTTIDERPVQTPTEPPTGVRLVVQRIRAFRSAAREWWAGLPWWGRVIGYLVLIGLAALLPWVGQVPLIGPQIVTQGIAWPAALFDVTYYVLLALGLNVVVGYAGMLDLGYVGFFGVGAYTVALLTSHDSLWHLQWPWLAALPFGVAVAMLSGVLLGWPTLRLRGDYLAIVTLGFASFVQLMAQNTSFLRGDQGFTQLPHPPGTFPDGSKIFGILDATPYFFLGLLAIVLVIVAVRNLDRSRVGRSWLAIREDEEAAEITGVRTVKYKLWAFAIGAFVGGLSGVVFVGFPGFMNHQQLALQFSILVLAGVVMGGAGNIPGAILGGTLIAYIPDRLRGINDPFTNTDLFQWRYVIFGAVIILIMLFRPQGLVPSRRRAMELRDRAKEVAP